MYQGLVKAKLQPSKSDTLRVARPKRRLRAIAAIWSSNPAVDVACQQVAGVRRASFRLGSQRSQTGHSQDAWQTKRAQSDQAACAGSQTAHWCRAEHSRAPLCLGSAFGARGRSSLRIFIEAGRSPHGLTRRHVQLHITQTGKPSTDAGKEWLTSHLAVPRRMWIGWLQGWLAASMPSGNRWRFLIFLSDPSFHMAAKV